MPSTIQCDSSSRVETSREGKESRAFVYWYWLRNLLDAIANNSSSIDRYRKIALNGCTTLLAKMGTLAITLIVSPLAYRNLGPERFGLWMTMTSFVLFTTFADLGIGNGLTMRIAEANGRDDQAYAKKQISCAFYLLCGICLLSILVTLTCTRFVNWEQFYGLNADSISREAKICTVILMLCTAANMPLGIAARIQLGYQNGFIPDLWNGFANLLILIASILVLTLKGGLPLLVLIFGGMPVLTAFCNLIAEFTLWRPSLKPQISMFDFRDGMHLAGIGFLFLVQQCFGLIYYASDNLVIANTMGAASVAKYALVQRLFSLGLITQYMVAPLWPAIGEAKARGDYKWAARATKRAMVGGTLFSIGLSSVLLLASRSVIRLWFKVDPGPIDFLRVGFALWVVIAGYVATMNALLNQPELMRRHLLLFGSGALASLALKIFFAKHASLSGVIWGTVISFGVIYMIPTAYMAIQCFSEREVKI